MAQKQNLENNAVKKELITLVEFSSMTFFSSDSSVFEIPPPSICHSSTHQSENKYGREKSED